jgi:ubiquinone/menaquinone biosynthesis C-methylase UbiE
MDADEAAFHYLEEYSRMAETYDRFVRPRFEPVAGHLVDLLDPREGERVLDLGAGTGNATLPIARRVGPGGSVTAVDAADGQLQVLRRRAAEAGLGNVRAEAMNADHLLFPRHAFDAAVSNLGVPVLRWEQTFGEVFRILRDGGRFAFSEWDGAMGWVTAYQEAQQPHVTATPSARLAELRTAVQAIRGHPDREALLDAARVEAALEGAGFSRVRTERRTVHPMFADIDAFLAFRLAWGYDELEWREMPAPSREAFREDLSRRFRERFGGVEGLEFRLFYTAAARE